MLNADEQRSIGAAIVPLAVVVALNAMIVCAPLLFLELGMRPMLPCLLLVAGSSCMCVAELRYSTRHTESLESFGAYQYASLAGSMLFLITKWSSLIEYLMKETPSDQFSALIGSALVIVGGTLRSLSLKSLGSGFCSRTSGIILVTDRIYAILRHPSEAGLLLASLGFTVTLAAWNTAMVVLPIALGTALYRMRLEELCLLNAFGAQYEDYCRQTGRWIPNVVRRSPDLALLLCAGLKSVPR